VVQSDAVAVVVPIPEQRFPHVSDSTADLLGGIHIAETCTVGIRLHGDTEVESVPTLSIEVDDRAKGKVQLFMKVTSGWMDLGCDGVWIAALGEPDRERCHTGDRCPCLPRRQRPEWYLGWAICSDHFRRDS
jgi:hypothetical protein